MRQLSAPIFQTSKTVKMIVTGLIGMSRSNALDKTAPPFQSLALSLYKPPTCNPHGGGYSVNLCVGTCRWDSSEPYPIPDHAQLHCTTLFETRHWNISPLCQTRWVSIPITDHFPHKWYPILDQKFFISVPYSTLKCMGLHVSISVHVHDRRKQCVNLLACISGLKQFREQEGQVELLLASAFDFSQSKICLQTNFFQLFLILKVGSLSYTNQY